MRKLILLVLVVFIVSCSVPVGYEATVYVYDRTGLPGTLTVTVNGVTKEVFGADSWSISWRGDQYKPATAFKKVGITAPEADFSTTTSLTDGTVESIDIY